MKNAPLHNGSFTRRDFLRILGGAAIGGLAAADARAFTRFLSESAALEMLVLGDSLIWGQGLKEEDKTYTLVANWMRTDAFRSPHAVNLKVKAHSGATLKFHQDDAERYKKIGRDENYPYEPELNIATPSTWKQIEMAAVEYRGAGISNGADLILISAGATDISVASILDPSGDNTKLREDIKRYCHRDMLDVLRFSAKENPSALIAVIGYFPMITRQTSSSKLLNAWLELRSFPRIFKPLLNNPVSMAVYFKKLRKRAQQRSTIWFEDSTASLRLAVDDLNKDAGRTRAVFVPSPIGEDAAFETPNSLLFRMRHDRTEDDLYAGRHAACDAALPQLKKDLGIQLPKRQCQEAAIGHPNPAGAKAYFEAVKTAVGPLMTYARG